MWPEATVQPRQGGSEVRKKLAGHTLLLTRNASHFPTLRPSWCPFVTEPESLPSSWPPAVRPPDR